MTQSSTQKIADGIIAVAAVGAACYVLKTPHLRRLAWRLGVVALTGTLPAWVSQEIRSGWEASGTPVVRQP